MCLLTWHIFAHRKSASSASQHLGIFCQCIAISSRQKTFTQIITDGETSSAKLANFLSNQQRSIINILQGLTSSRSRPARQKVSFVSIISLCNVLLGESLSSIPLLMPKKSISTSTIIMFALFGLHPATEPSLSHNNLSSLL